LLINGQTGELLKVGVKQYSKKDAPGVETPVNITCEARTQEGCLTLVYKAASDKTLSEGVKDSLLKLFSTFKYALLH